MNMAPEICRAALVYVPFVDVVNTMLDESIPLTTQEFIEWGNPKIEEQYRWIRSYSPYDNVGALDYPAMLVRTSLNDSQVPYWEPCKWVARLRALRADADPLLLKVDLSSGHGGASGRYDSLRDRAYDFAFVLAMIGEKI
jgi:oligopeptidase B